ncbi:hypothetical protein [Escherichia coli]
MTNSFGTVISGRQV